MSVHLEVGGTVWLFDLNRRVYEHDAAGTVMNGGGPIYREHFVQRIITGETSTSWIVGNGKPAYGGGKIPKNLAKRDAPDRHGGYYLTLEAVEDCVWDNHHRINISNAIKFSGVTTDQLRAIAKIIGYGDLSL